MDKQREKRDLLACPFCGDCNDMELTETDVKDLKGYNKWAVYCNSCFCQSPPQSQQSDAIEAWNRRALKLNEKEIRQAAIEECAKVCENMMDSSSAPILQTLCMLLANAIRNLTKGE